MNNNKSRKYTRNLVKGERFIAPSNAGDKTYTVEKVTLHPGINCRVVQVKTVEGRTLFRPMNDLIALD